MSQRNKEYTLGRCWEILGFNPRKIAEIIAEQPSIDGMLIESERLLQLAEKSAKKLMRKYHPDVNKSSGSQRQFQEVNAAIICLRVYTSEFKEKCDFLKKNPPVPPKERITFNNG